MDKSTNPYIVVEDHDAKLSTHRNRDQERLLQQIPNSPPEDEHFKRNSYVPSDSHENLAQALEDDPLAIRESLVFALGTNNRRPQWMVADSEPSGDETSISNNPMEHLQETRQHHPNDDVESDSYSNPFDYPDTSRDLTYDIPLITLNTGAVDYTFNENDDLEAGFQRPPLSPSNDGEYKFRPGSPSKFSNMFTRISDRIAGSNNPPTPPVDRTSHAFEDNEMIDKYQVSRQSSMVEEQTSSVPSQSSHPSHATPKSPRSEASGASLHGYNLQVNGAQRSPQSFTSHTSLDTIRSIPSVELTQMPNVSAPTLQVSTSNVQQGMAPVTAIASPHFKAISRDSEAGFDYLYLYGNSLKIFSPTSKVRIWCHRVISHPRTNPLVLVLIVLQTVLLLYRQWDPINNGGYYYSGYNWADYILMAINALYTFEIAVKIIAYGFIDDEAMFEQLGLNYPRSGITYARQYIQELMLSNFFWWIPRIKYKLSKNKKEKMSSFEPNLKGKYAQFTDDEIHVETIQDCSNIMEETETSEESTGKKRGNSSFPLPGSPAKKFTFNGYNSFLQSTHIHKKVEEMNLHRAYLRSNWQRLDFVSVVSFWISLLLSIDHYDAKHHFMIFRALSCLRILRLCNLTTGTNIILRACESAIPQLVDVSIVIACFWVIFGVIGVQSFKSSLTRHCEWTNPDDPTETYINSDLYCGSYIGLDGHAKPYIDRYGNPSINIKGFRCPQYSVCRSGENPYNGTVNFDNVLQSMQLVFVVMSVNAFSDIMYFLMDTDNLLSALFFIFGILILTIWLMNIFIAVIVSSFKIILKEDAEVKRQREERRSNKFFSNIWRFNDEMHTRQVLELIQQRKYLRLYYRVQYAFVLIISCALIVQCLRAEDMVDDRAHFLYRCEAVFTGTLLAEIVIRFILYLPHWKVFFMSKMNAFDLLLAIITSIIIVKPVKEKLGQAYYWLTFFQIARFYRVVLAHRVTSDLWLKLMRHVKAIYDLALFYFILLILVSLIGARFFEGQIPVDKIADVEFAMHTFPNAFISFYVVTSTENWANVMYELQETAVSTAQRSFGSIFIIAWFIISNSIVMNIFIAVIARALEISEDGKRKHQLRQFIDDMTQKLLAVGNNPGWITQIKAKIFGKEEDRNLERAVTNLLLSGTAVNDFLDNDDKCSDEEEIEQVNTFRNPENKDSQKSWWQTNPLKKLKTFSRNPFFNKKKKATFIDGDFNPAIFAKEVIKERKKLIQEQDEFLRANPMFNTVFYMLGPRHRLRRVCQRVVPSSYGERIDGVEPNKTVSEVFALVMFLSTIFIVVSACYLTPLLRRDVIYKHGQYNWTFYLDTSFIVIFTLELLIKTIADGLILTPNAYMRSPWNWLDFCALLSLWIELIAFLKNDGNLSRVVRGLKALRALRILTISETAKNNFHYTMISGFGKIVSAGIISLTLLFPFSVWGLNIFNGRLGYCVDGQSSLEECVNEYSNLVFEWQILSPNVYVQPILEMNKFLSSFATLYEIVSLEGWTDLLINVMQSTGVGTPQEMFASPFNGFFIILFNFTSVVFVLTLFVSVIIDNYARVTGRAYLTDSQRQWYHVKKFLMQVKPSKRRKPETMQGIRRFCYRMTVEKNKIWGSVLNSVLLLHVLALLIERFPESFLLTSLRYACFIVSSSCFLNNYLMYAYAQGYKVFIANKWNIFCFVVSLGAWLSTVLSYCVNSGSVFINFNKLFLVAMLVFVFPRSDRLSQMLKFASASFPQLISLLFTWFVMFLVYAIAMNQIFGMTKIGSNTSGNINARSVPKAFILLFRCSMGEGWNYIMEDFTLEAPFCESNVKLDDTDCGNKQYAYLLFMSWNVISMYIMLNLFVSLILDSFSYINGGSKYAHLISRAEIRKYKQHWHKFDPEGTGFIDPADLSKFLHSLEGSLSFHFYSGVLSIRELCDKWIKRNDPLNPYDITVNYQSMNDVMQVMDIPKIQERRRLYEQFMEEAIMNMELHEESGISFKRLLIQIPLYNSFKAHQCLTLIDFLERRLFLKKLEKRLRTKRFYELLEGYVCRWKYVKNKRTEHRRSYTSPESGVAVDPNSNGLLSDPYKLF